MRIAFFGGTFDPPHRGHIAAARAAIERLKLDRVLLAPVAAQPLKGNGAHASFEDRLAMVQLAVQGEPRLAPSSADAPRPGGKPNYTLDTLTELRRSFAPDDQLFCLLGADALLSLKRWHQAAELLLFCDFIVVGRPGFSLDRISEALPEGVRQSACRHQPEGIRIELEGPAGGHSALYLIPDLEEDISATEVRAALAEGAQAQTVLAPEVARYIRAHHLYQDLEPGTRDKRPGMSASST
jgi:nicotinate-nucleotide adenylyltransferase